MFCPSSYRWNMQWFVLLLILTVPISQAKDRGQLPPGVDETIDKPLAEVLAAVKQVAEDQTIHGTYVYANEILTGAHSATSSKAFSQTGSPGTVVYKVAEGALAPRNFKGSNDMGTITVRYVVEDTGSNTTRLRIDAVFIETSRKRADPSEGMVELAEYGAIQQQLDAAAAKRRREADDLERRQQEQAAAAAAAEKARLDSQKESSREEARDNLQRQVDQLRHQLEARAKLANVPLKSAPFRKATTLQLLDAQAEVVILAVTPYWYGVETSDGTHGWIRRSELEPLP